MNIQFTLGQTLLAQYKCNIKPVAAACIIDSMRYDLTAQEWQMELFKQYQNEKAELENETAEWMMEVAMEIVKLFGE